MTASINFRRLFTKTNLRELYYSKIRFKSAVGIDRVNRRAFENKIEENINIIYRKVRNGSYNFSPYREKLISRGRGKFPRVVSIPTIRDKLVLKALYENLKQIYDDETPFVHNIIDEISTLLGKNRYDGVIRLDVKDFYPSINHDFLLNQIGKKIKKKEIRNLIIDAIKQQTVAKIKRGDEKKNDMGVPQGLSISNILANIYFLQIDGKYKNKESLSYFRYVDDILILCKCSNIEKIKKEIRNDCKQLNLELHGDDDPEKTKSCMISDEFGYLGYNFQGSMVTVRKKSVDHLRESIIKLFTNYKYSESRDLTLLKWTIDLRITGCIFKGTKYGWLFFFSKVNDFQLLSSLDHFIKKQAERFRVDLSVVTFKKFLRAFHEITNNLTITKYVPNFDQFSIQNKRRLLSDIFNLRTQFLTPNDIEYQFNKRIYQTVKDLEKDLARAS